MRFLFCFGVGILSLLNDSFVCGDEWISLFNGKDLTGWSKIHDVDFEVRDGNLYLVKGMGWLRTDQVYDDFILEFECKPLVENYDSGIFIRAGLEGKPWPDSGFQINLKQDAFGTLVRGYRPMIPSEIEGVSVGEWAFFRLEIEGENAVLKINGEQAWEADFIEPEIGLIGIQVENREFEFRNLRIRDIGYIDLLEGEETDFKHLKVHSGPADSWKLTNDGVLVCQGASGGWIGAKSNEFSNFILKLDFLVPKEGNSGVFIRHPGKGGGSSAGMEIQIIDDDAKHWGTLKDWQKTGSIYRKVAPSVRAFKEAGVWQSMQIVANQKLVQVYVNGVEVVNADLDQDEELKKRPRQGYIGFQNYDGNIQFRNVRVKTLD